MNAADVRQFALALPGATEEPHFHFQSFRVGGKIFATMPPENQLLHVFVPAEEREAVVLAFPEACSELQWGKRLVGVRVELARASRELVEGLLRTAYDSHSPN